MKKMKQKNTILGIEKYPSHNVQPYKCEYCDYITSDASNFSKHLKTPKHQMKQMKPKVVLNEKNKVFQCKYCNKILKSRTTLWRHEKKCNGCEENDTIQDIKKELEKLKMENAILKGENNILKDNSVPQTITNNNTFNVQLSPSGILPFEDADTADKVNVANPRFDYIPPDLVNLYVTNFSVVPSLRSGSHQPSYIYRLLNEYYCQEDYTL